MSIFSERLKAARLLKGISQTELCRTTGIMPCQYSNWENGNREPILSSLKKLCIYFNISADYFLGIEVYPIPKHSGDLMTDLSKRDRYIMSSLLELLSKNKEDSKL